MVKFELNLHIKRTSISFQLPTAEGLAEKRRQEEQKEERRKKRAAKRKKRRLNQRQANKQKEEVSHW